jgi:hypothetical protein
VSAILPRTKEEGVSSEGSKKRQRDKELRDLRVEDGEVITLSPNLPAFAGVYRVVQPRSIDEVREVLGPSHEAQEAVRRQLCCQPEELGPRVVSLEELESDDPAVREPARALAYAAGRHFLATGDPSLTAWKAVIDRFIQLNVPNLHIAEFNDIIVANNARLLVSASTNAIEANAVKLFGTGTIVLGGPTTFRVQSFEGKIGALAPVGGVSGQAS